MILSILIPVYNYNCVALVKALQQQAENCNIDYEILVADDGTDNAAVVCQNREINAIPHSFYHEMGKNHGRSWIRNWLVGQSQGEFLLFIDSDAEVCNAHFIGNYLRHAEKGAVICGGILHPEEEPSPTRRLRYRYEKAMEPCFTAERRNQHPYANLRTFNFMMPREVALSHPFDESITLYGYEDTLLGGMFEKEGLKVIHIDNPLINADIEENPIFLKKTEESMHSLYQLKDKMRHHSRLLTSYEKIRRLKLDTLLRIVFPLLRPVLTWHLTGKQPTVIALQFYKLAYYCTLCK